MESVAAFAWNGWQACYGINGSFGVEQVAALPWNRWQDSPGIGGSFGVEYAELCAVLYHISPMALYRLVCAFGHHSLVTVLTRCGLPLPTYFLADEKHSRCLTRL